VIGSEPVKYGFYGGEYKDAVTMKVTVNINKTHDIYNIVDENTYSFVFKGYEGLEDQRDGILRQTLNFTVQKLLPTEVILPEFRTAQSEDGKKFISYMVPDSLDTAEETHDVWKTDVWDWEPNNTASKSNLWAKNASYTAATIQNKNYKGRMNGFKDLNNVFYDLNKDTLYQFNFKTSNYWNTTNLKNLNSLVSIWEDGDEVEIIGVNPPFVGDGYEEASDGDYLAYKTKYVLSVPKAYIDATTEHSIDVSHKYPGVSTKLDQNGNVSDALYKQTHLATTEDAFTVIYAPWIKASTFSNIAKPELQWLTTPEVADTLSLTNIKSVNTYNGELFSKNLSALINAEYLMPVVKKIQFVSANGHVNEYFKPVDAEDGPGVVLPLFELGEEQAASKYGKEGDIVLLVTQVSTQLDANPIADHDENLEITVVDAFNIEHKISVPVTIKRAPNGSARKR
jgi:hypothetical protein